VSLGPIPERTWDELADLALGTGVALFVGSLAIRLFLWWASGIAAP
jgi:hypothetical protein